MAYEAWTAGEVDANSPWGSDAATKNKSNTDFLEAITGTRIILTPADFVANGVAAATYGLVNGYLSAVTTVFYAQLHIPAGYKVTHAKLYGDDATNTFEVFACDITDGTTEDSLGAACNVNTEKDLTDDDSSATNYISIKWSCGNTDQLFGGYLTIARI